MWGYRKVEYIADCIQGNVRRNNEDNFFCNGVTLPLLHTDLDQPVRGSASTMNSLLFAVCDGMGGEAAGEAASFMGVETIKGEATGYTDLEYMIKNMNQKVCEYARNHHISSMGSTAAILKMKGGMV